MEFARCPDRYSVGNNCNHLTAKTLRQLGCDVSGVIVWSNFKVVGSPGDAPLGYGGNAAIAPAVPPGSTGGAGPAALADAPASPATPPSGVAAVRVGASMP